MKRRLNTAFATAGVAAILLTGCVSSKKYKASQSELSRVRNDSAQLAQQVGSLNGNVSDLQNKNTTLQRSLDSSNSSYATQQKSLDYYQGYFKNQQSSLSQVSDDVKGALTQAGIANADVQQTDGAVYVRLNENDVFKKGSTVISKTGKQALDGVAQAIKNRANVNVFIGGDDSAASSGTMASTDGTTSMPADDAAPVRPRRHHASHPMASHKAAGVTSGGTQSGSSASSAGSGVASNNGVPAHKKHHRRSPEGSMAFNNGMGPVHNRAWALHQGRMVTVANSFLHNGMGKVNVSLQKPPMGGGASNTIKVTIAPNMSDFNPQGTSATGLRQSDAASR